MFKLAYGKTTNEFFPVTPSTEFTDGELVTFVSGKLVSATAGTSADAIAGVFVGDVKSTDKDYDEERTAAIEVPQGRHAVYEADVASGLVKSDIGAEFDLADSESVNRGASTVGVVKCVGVEDSEKGYFYVKVNGSY